MDVRSATNFHSIPSLELASPLVAKTSTPYTIQVTDCIVQGNVSGAAAFTLPTAVGIAGQEFTVQNVNGSGAITVSTTSAQTINGASTFVVPATSGSYVQVVSDGANWWVIDSTPVAASGLSLGKAYAGTVNCWGM